MNSTLTPARATTATTTARQYAQYTAHARDCADSELAQLKSYRLFVRDARDSLDLSTVNQLEMLADGTLSVILELSDDASRYAQVAYDAAQQVPESEEAQRYADQAFAAALKAYDFAQTAQQFAEALFEITASVRRRICR